MKITTKIYKSGGIDCLSKNCTFRKECAVHTTAGDYRSEDGFTPDLFEENGQFFCRTQDEPIGVNIKQGFFPVDYDKMCRGSLVFVDGEILHYEDYFGERI